MSKKLYKPWPVTRETLALDILALQLERSIDGIGLVYIVEGHPTTELGIALDCLKAGMSVQVVVTT